MTHPTPVKPETSGDAPDFEKLAKDVVRIFKQHNEDEFRLGYIEALASDCYQLGIESGRKWRKIDDGLPYDEIVLCYREDGNIIQSWWHDCSLDEFISRHKFTHWQPITPPEQS